MVQKFLGFLVLTALSLSCAQVGSPTGGPRDKDPPRVLESIPTNYSTHFEAKKIQITFDEYIVLDNVNQELIVSPPMEEQPEVKLKKKTLIIEFEEELKENTTYTFNFGNAIIDLHEGNKLQNFEYVFSTGDILDSMSVKGNLRYAETLEKPEEAISIMLYTDLRDSVPLTEIPLYVGRSNDSGVFSVNNLRPGEYKVFALKDGNNNLLFDLPGEEIAFLDTSLTVNADFVRQLMGIEAEDTIVNLNPDSIQVSPMQEDSTLLVSDTIPDLGPDLTSLYIDLILFTEPSEIQYITDYTREDPRKLETLFALPLTDSFAYDILPEPGEEIRYLEDFSEQRDSLTLWIIDSLQYRKDSLYLALQYTAKDTSNRSISFSDTLIFAYKEKTTKKKKKNESKSVEKLEVLTIRNGGSQGLYHKLALNLNLPLEQITDSLISLYHIPDSVEFEVPFKAIVDSLQFNRALLSVEWEPEANYRLEVLPGALTSFYPLEHDTIDVSFKTRDPEYYGKILLNLSQVNHRILVQLLDNGKVLLEKEVDRDGQYAFPNLEPREYTIKFVHDLNKNGKWDTGKYLKKLQPEPVEFLPGKIEVRSNWDHDVSMSLKK